MIGLKRTCLSVACVLLVSAVISAQDFDPNYLATFSIIARDPATGEIGVGVQSKAFAAGNRAYTVKGGVGVIAHQSSANPMYGQIGIALLERGLTPQQALDMMRRSDEGRESRQVSILDFQGRGATFTGTGASDWKGGRCAKDYCVQGNILTGPEVVDALEKSFLSTAGQPLADRLMTALEAGQAAGGDARGQQSGAIVVARPLTNANSFNDRVIDIRVDDSKNPFREMRRILDLSRSGQLITEANTKATAGDLPGALKLVNDAVAKSPENDNAYVAKANIHLKMNQKTEAFAAVRKAVELNPANKLQLPKNTNFKDVVNDPEFKRITGS